jgi:hypothetical protein
MGEAEMIATTATSLGFDFIPNPTIMALPDNPPSSTHGKCLSTTPLGVTPNTPALIPTHSNDADVDGDNEDDDWEHITDFDDQKVEQKEDKVVDDGEIIILGEMDLGDHAHATVNGNGLGQVQGKGKKGMRKDKSYAAVVGTVE